MMNQLKEDERELVKLANYFKKKAEKLILEGKLPPEHQQVMEACDRLIKTIYDHSALRDEISKKRETIKSSIKDFAICPHCNSNEYLKFIGVDSNEKGYKFNKYKCRRCNIQFSWNRPNNPWDMIAFTEDLLAEFHKKIEEQSSPDEKEASEQMIHQLEGNLNLVRPIIKQSDQEFEDMKTRDEEISKMIKEFKNYLLIQKVLIDSIN